MSVVFLVADYKINCAGLKPNTMHSFFLDGVNQQTGWYAPLGLCFKDNGSTDLISDSSGRLAFTYHFTDLWTIAQPWDGNPGHPIQDNMFYIAASVEFIETVPYRKFSLQSADGTSYAEVLLPTKLQILNHPDTNSGDGNSN